jgi:hypothetical protein
MNIFSFGCTSKSIANLIEATHIYREIYQFRGFYHTSHHFDVPKLSDTRLMKLKPAVLQLSREPFREYATLKAIAPNLTSLFILRIKKSVCSYGEISSLIATMTNLTELNVVDLSNKTDYFMTLPPLPKLKKLKLSSEVAFTKPAPIGGYDWAILRNMPNLEILDARPNLDILDFSRLTFLTSLRDLYIEIDDLESDKNIKCLTTSSFQSLKNIYIDDPVDKNELHLLESIPEGLDVHYRINSSSSSSDSDSSDDDDGDDDDSSDGDDSDSSDDDDDDDDDFSLSDTDSDDDSSDDDDDDDDDDISLSDTDSDSNNDDSNTSTEYYPLYFCSQ